MPMAAILGGGRAEREPEAEIRYGHGHLHDWMRTSSSLNLMSAQLLLNSQTSRSRVSAASANAASSSAVLRLKRNTTSPPYLANKADGTCGREGRRGADDWPRGPFEDGAGKRKTVCMMLSRSHVNRGKTDGCLRGAERAGVDCE